MAGYLGTYPGKIDPKSRMHLVVPLRRTKGAAEGDEFVLCQSFDRCLRLYDSAGWQAFEKVLADLPPGAKRKKAIRFFSEKSRRLQMDAQGRLLLPRDFLEACGIKDEVKLVGALEYIEIWPPDAFQQEVASAEDELGELKELL